MFFTCLAIFEIRIVFHRTIQQTAEYLTTELIVGYLFVYDAVLAVFAGIVYIFRIGTSFEQFDIILVSFRHNPPIAEYDMRRLG